MVFVSMYYWDVAATKIGYMDEFESLRLVDVARAIDQRTYLIVLLGGEAGLRCGEMIALEWGDVDLAKRQLCGSGDKAPAVGKPAQPSGAVPFGRPLFHSGIIRRCDECGVRPSRRSGTSCSHSSAPAGWARSIARATCASTARSP